MDAAAMLTSKGQITLPKSVREALGLSEGDEVAFRVQGNRAILTRTPDFLALAGSIPVPPGRRCTGWDNIVRKTRAQRVTDYV